MKTTRLEIPEDAERLAMHGSVLKFDTEGTCKICTPMGECSRPFPTDAITRKQHEDIAQQIVDAFPDKLSGFDPCPDDTCAEIKLHKKQK